MTQPTWNQENVAQLFELPFIELIFKAQSIHRQHFNANEIELCKLFNIKTGACPEDCSYCSQSGHYKTDIQRETAMNIDDILAEARKAKENGVTRFCMGAAWRSPPKKDLPKVVEIIKAVKQLGLETCVTLGMLDNEQVLALKAAGLDFYNHNLDTSPEHYKKIVSTHTYEDRLATLERVRDAGINVCCGGILGLGETREDRIAFLVQLANLPEPPQSVPINQLIPIKGTPLEHNDKIDNFEFIRSIAVARILMPTSIIRLSAGRLSMSQEMQTWCFMAGANSMWFGNKYLTAQNHEEDTDTAMLKKLGITLKQTILSEATL